MNKFTNTIRNDAWGAQLQTIVFTICYCYFHNLEYYYTIPDLKYVYEEESENLETLYNFRNYFKNQDRVVTFDNKADICPLDIGTCYNFIENNIDAVLNTEFFYQIQNVFKSGKKSNYNNEYINIAISIRRPSTHKNIDLSSHHNGEDVKLKDIKDISNTNERFTKDEYFLEVINRLRNLHNGKKILFHIYSDGKIEYFTAFKADDIVLHVNESISDTVNGLIFADILVTSVSSFSYILGILSGIKEVIYIPFWHKVPSFWKTINQIA